MSRDDLNFWYTSIYLYIPILSMSQDMTFSIPLNGGFPQARHHRRVFRHLETPPSWLECASNMPGWQRGRRCAHSEKPNSQNPQKKIEGWKMVMFLNRFVFFVEIFLKRFAKKRSLGFGGVEPYFLEYKVYVYMHLHGIQVQQTYLSFDPQTRMYNILHRVAHISFSPTHVVPTKYPPHGIQAPRR